MGQGRIYISSETNKLLLILYDISIEGGLGALALLKSADIGCLYLTSFHLNLDLLLCFTIDVWTAFCDL